MKTCRICGEKKEDEEFFRLRHFYKWNKSNVVWCRECQKQFMEMKAEEERKKVFLGTKLSHLVTFD